ncbi:hypothetical protein AB0I81_51015 [Nonomuraea sp. NPDC050404]|uniref:hypothetical protein n=1 Tax=Nonomuraea sp. NPDC050404 TaxID=3155783 RepID=UPI0033D3A7A3
MAVDARQRNPPQFALTIGPPMCRTRAEEHVTSMNSAIFASKKAAENRESAGQVGYGVVGRPGLEPGTYGLKVARYCVGPYFNVFNCITLLNFVAFKMSENVGQCSRVPIAEEHVTSTRPGIRCAMAHS